MGAETSGPTSTPVGASAIVKMDAVMVVVMAVAQMEAVVPGGLEVVAVGLMRDAPLARARPSLGTRAQARRRRPSGSGFEAGFVMTVGGGGG